MVVNSLYDGDHFGDLAMLSTLNGIKSEKKQSQLFRSFTSRFNPKPEKSKDAPSNKILPSLRSATVKITEHTCLLSLSHLQYRHIYNHILKKELEDKLEVLSSSTQFSSLEPFLLLPLANALQEESFRLGEEVIGRGMTLQRMYLVARGKCDLMIGGGEREIGERKKEEFEGKEKREEGWKNKKKGEEGKKEEDMKKIGGLIGERKIVRQEEGERKVDHPCPSYSLLPIGCFTRGDVFCQRALLNKDDLERKELNFEKKFGVLSNLSVVSDSNETLLYFIDKEKFNEIPYGLKETIKNILIEDQEFDDLNVLDLEAKERRWRNRTQKTYKEVIKRRKVKREFLI